MASVTLLCYCLLQVPCQVETSRLVEEFDNNVIFTTFSILVSSPQYVGVAQC